MHATLRALTAIEGEAVLYDASAFADLLQTPFARWRDRLDEEVGARHCLLLRSHGAGHVQVDVFVDESPPTSWADRLQRPHFGHLALPNGRLVAAPPDKLDTEGQTMVLVPSGVYVCTAFELRPGSDDEAADAIRADIPRRYSGAAVALASGTLGAGCLLAVLSALAVLLAVILLVADFEFGWHVISRYGVWLLGGWAAFLLLRFVPTTRAIRAIDRRADLAAEETDPPDLVVHLERTALTAATEPGIVVCVAT